MNRKEILNKTNGRCGYCGCELGKGWHISPINPVSVSVGLDGSLFENNNDMENMLAACKHCAMSKTHIGMNGRTQQLTIENFKAAILSTYDIMKDTPYYKRAIKYGLIQEVKTEVVFYFETLGIKTKK